ncbi:MAG: GNAT family N-acetyltransferase, partial [Rubrobacteraceae bacterium]
MGNRTTPKELNARGRHRLAGALGDTLEGWRGRGLATAAASLVVGRVQRSDRVPVWSAGEDNYASLQVARKLGFVERF